MCKQASGECTYCSTTTNPSACSTRLIIDPAAGCKVVGTGSIAGLGPRYADSFAERKKEHRTRHVLLCRYVRDDQRLHLPKGGRAKLRTWPTIYRRASWLPCWVAALGATANPRNIKWRPSTPRSAAPGWHRGCVTQWPAPRGDGPAASLRDPPAHSDGRISSTWQWLTAVTLLV